MKYIIGIDPGKNGGIAMLNEDGKVINVEKMPETPKDLLNHLVALVAHAASTASQMCEPSIVVYIEKVGGIPGQGASSAFSFGRGCGHLEMALLALKLRTNDVTPQKWQKLYSVGHSSITTSTAAEKKEHKLKLKAKCQSLFPSLGKKITNATCDALLIAEYGRKQEVGK